MKGTIIKCLEELVVNKFGKDKWEMSAKNAGLDSGKAIFSISDVDDSQTMKIVESVCNTLGISLEQAADAFGDYWVNVYSQKMYSHYYDRDSAKSFLLNMDNVHVAMTKQMKNARPPRFEYEWKDDKTLVMHYKSHRGLIDFVVGLARGVGNYYKEDLHVTKLGNKEIQIVFKK